MAKQSQSEQLDKIVDAILAGPARELPRPRSKPAVQLASLASIAKGLRGLPQERFKANLKTDLIRRATMATKPVGVPPIPEGFHSITPYILVSDASKFIDFLKTAFGATEKFRMPKPDGKIMHAEVRIADSMIELSDGSEQYLPTPVAIHLHVDDVDATYAQALKAGATSTHEPVDQPYGEREAGVKDPFGNSWYIAKATGWTPKPGELLAVQPYLHLHNANKMIPFLAEAFGAEALGVHKSPEGLILHATIRIGDATLEISEAHGPYQPSPCHLHLYVLDTDAVYAQAMRAGATSVEAPVDKPYGDRSASVRDAWGNSWFIATHIKDVAF